MNFTNFVQSHLKEYRKGVLCASLLLAFLVSFSTSSQAQSLSTATGFKATKSSSLTATPKTAPAAIGALQTEIDKLRSSFPIQVGFNEAVWDIKITYFEAVRLSIKDLNKTAASAIFEEVDRTLLPTASRYKGISNALLQSIVDEAVTLTH